MINTDYIKGTMGKLSQFQMINFAYVVCFYHVLSTVQQTGVTNVQFNPAETWKRHTPLLGIQAGSNNPKILQI